MNIGKKENQEDALWPTIAYENPNLLILCDGMGGHKDGEIASRCVVDVLNKNLSALPVTSFEKAEKNISHSLKKVYATLNELDYNDSEGKTMGTTLILMMKCINGILVAHIGDSRMYLLRNDTGIVFRTRDHSVVAELIACGEMTEAEARVSPLKNRITKAIQPCQGFMTTPTYDRITDISNGDVIFLCSDGIIEQITDDELACILIGSMDLSKKLDEINKLCIERNTQDNHSCIAIQIDAIDKANEKKVSLWQRIVKALEL